MRRRTIVCLTVAALTASAQAADVGGWFSDQQRAAAQAGSPAAAPCAQAIQQAAADPSAIKAYHAALCYLQAETPDMLAAKAWLTRSAELKFLPADRLLRSLLIAEAGPHRSQPHCHDLGEGRQICHGGAPGAAPPPN